MSVNGSTLSDGVTPRCQGLTKSGTQCRKAAQHDFETCAQHRKQDRQLAEPVDLSVESMIAADDGAWHRRPARVRPSGIRTAHHRQQQYGAEIPGPNLERNRAERRLRQGRRLVGFTPIERGQQLRSNKSAAKRAARLAKRARVLHARGNRRSA